MGVYQVTQQGETMTKKKVMTMEEALQVMPLPFNKSETAEPTKFYRFP
jgi:hypothetical protein